MAAMLVAAVLVCVPGSDVVFADDDVPGTAAVYADDGESGTAALHAEESVPGMTHNIGNVLKKGMGTTDAATIWFGLDSKDKPLSWRVIGFGSQEGSAAPKAGCISLLAAGMLDQQAYDESWWNYINYKDSPIRGFVKAIPDGFTDLDKSAMVSREIVSGELDPMWLLSQNDAGNVSKDLRAMGPDGDPHQNENTWWLTDTVEINDDDDYGAMYVMGDGEIDNGGWGSQTIKGVRPGFHLDQSKVLFLSAAVGGKTSDDEGADALVPVAANTTGEWKLTLKGENRDGFKAQLDSFDGKTVNASYSGAVMAISEYLSAVITDKDGQVKYYGRIKGIMIGLDVSGDVSINVEGKYKKGDHFYLFNERCNGDKKSDCSSELVELDLDAEGGDEPVSATIKASKKTVKKGKRTTVKVTSNSGAKLTVKSSNKKAKTALKKKYVKISNGKTAKITFTKKAPKGKYKFKVTSPSKDNFKKTEKTITINVK